MYILSLIILYPLTEKKLLYTCMFESCTCTIILLYVKIVLYRYYEIELLYTLSLLSL